MFFVTRNAVLNGCFKKLILRQCHFTYKETAINYTCLIMIFTEVIKHMMKWNDYDIVSITTIYNLSLRYNSMIFNLISNTILMNIAIDWNLCRYLLIRLHFITILLNKRRVYYYTIFIWTLTLRQKSKFDSCSKTSSN